VQGDSRFERKVQQGVADDRFTLLEDVACLPPGMLFICGPRPGQPKRRCGVRQVSVGRAVSWIAHSLVPAGATNPGWPSADPPRPVVRALPV
jgi:hypothetical protein